MADECGIQRSFSGSLYNGIHRRTRKHTGVARATGTHMLAFLIVLMIITSFVVEYIFLN